MHIFLVNGTDPVYVLFFDLFARLPVAIIDDVQFGLEDAFPSFYPPPFVRCEILTPVIPGEGAISDVVTEPLEAFLQRAFVHFSSSF